ncbi:MAG: hypothetical protein NTY81_00655 [Candidatus Staskawiczbacteria bacterium]|nr:hypothetical protein [Candidatus Staskawiczbacteria bacterium]
MKSLQKIGILGYGEIGKAISKFYNNPKIKDLKRDDGLAGVDILHICIPWSRDFVKIVKKEIKKANPKLTIIHSTVAPGTTKKIGGMIVHSPVRGVHPKLFEGIKTFVKYIGADSEKAGKMAESHLKSLGIKTKIFYPSKTTEAIKLWDTTQYGWLIVLNKEMKKWCDKNKVDFEAVYADANKTYNEGYKKLGREEVLRPYLKYVPGKIGGHCVIPNCQILKDGIAKIILKRNESC